MPSDTGPVTASSSRRARWAACASSLTPRHRIANSSPRDPVVAAVVALAHALDLDVVAEGVETTQQLDELARLGCKHAQGFLFSLPLPGDELGIALADAARDAEEEGLS